MSAKDNGYGESMPDEMAVNLWFGENGQIVSEVGLPLGGSVSPDIKKLPDEAWVQPGPDKRMHTLDQPKHSFAYLDCGRWGGPAALGTPQRCFGIIWGAWTALCRFVPDSSKSTADNYILDKGARADNQINDVIDSLRGPNSSVEVIKSLWSSTPIKWAQDWNTIYVILPDLHLPIVGYYPHSFPVIEDGHETRRLYDSDGKYTGRLDYTSTRSWGIGETTDDEGMVEIYPGSKNRKLGKAALTWFERYLAGDIYGGPTGAAANDLVAFATLLGKANRASQIHFVQVGDMYDLWIGLNRFFDGRDGHSVALGDRDGIRAGDFIDFWTNRTNQLFPNMMSALSGLGVGTKSWLWGNHDNYLAAHTPSGIPTRIKEIRKGGVYIEHGQRGDDWNRDGATKGHWMTNRVFEHPIIRSFDPDRRSDFTKTAALSYASQPDFCVYAMGHTHSPFLTRVNLALKKYETPPPATGD